jgi:hypothetical protein
MPGTPEERWVNLAGMAVAGPFFVDIENPTSPYFCKLYERPSLAKAAIVFEDAEAQEWFRNVRRQQDGSLRDYNIHMINDTKQFPTFVVAVGTGPGDNSDDRDYVNVHQRYNAEMHRNTKGDLDAFCRQKDEDRKKPRFALLPQLDTDGRHTTDDKGRVLCALTKPNQINYLSWVWRDQLQRSMRVCKKQRKARRRHAEVGNSNNSSATASTTEADAAVADAVASTASTKRKRGGSVKPKAPAQDAGRKNRTRKKRQCLASDYKFAPVISKPGVWVIDC